MNPTVPLIVIVIFVVVWIVSNVIRAQQDAAQAAARRVGNKPNAAPMRAPEKTTSTDIDRFLQEIDRLRKKAQPEQQPSAQKPEAVKPIRKPAPPPQPKRDQQQPPRRPQGERKRPVSEMRPSVASKAEPPKPVSVPLPMSPPPLTAAKTAVEIAHPASIQPVFAAGAVDRPSRPAQAGAPISASMELLQTFFKSKQGMATAVLLHEILAEPKCRRRH